MKELTSEELKEFNGKEGKPVYVAFQGRVYDVSTSRLWSGGTHMNRHASGKNLSGEIKAAPHGPDVLERYPQVGVLKETSPEELKHLPGFLRDLLRRFPMARRHPHPVMVHFPIAFCVGASLFALLHALFQKPFFEITSYHLLILGTLTSPFAVASGLMTWWINYHLKRTLYIRRKIQLSVLLLLMEIILTLWRSSVTGGAVFKAHPVYFVLVLLLTPVVLALGYYGGQMTFPPESPTA